jgi:hypothetical protein
MGLSRQTGSVLAVLGVLLIASPAWAWWGHGGVVVRQRYVYRGPAGGPVWFGTVPRTGVELGTFGGGLELAPLGWTSFGTTTELAPLGWTYGTTRLGSSTTEAARLIELGRQLEKSAAPNMGTSTGNAPAGGGGTTTATITCSALTSRMDKIEGKLDTLQASVNDLERKVNQLVAERDQAQFQQMIQQQVQQAVAQQVKPLLEQQINTNAQVTATLQTLKKKQEATTKILLELQKKTPDQATLDSANKILADP